MLTDLYYSFEFFGPFINADMIFANLSDVEKMLTSIMLLKL